MRLFTQILCASALTLGALTSSADAHEIKIGKLVIHHPWIRMAIGSAPAAAYTTIDNTGSEDDTLIKVTVEGVPSVQIHEMKMEGETMKMGELKDGLVIPAGKSVELKPKTLHIMLMGMKAAFKVGGKVLGTMTFAKAGTVNVDFEVRAPQDDMPGMKMN